MADTATLLRFGELLEQGYLPSVGSWVQVDRRAEVTTRLNAFNTLGNQSMELFLIGQDGGRVGEPVQRTLGTGKALRLDLDGLVPADRSGFEGCLWIWCRGDTSEGSLGLQAINLEFIDRRRPAGHILGTVHVIIDFFDTLGLPPFLDLVSPRVMVEQTPEGAPRYRNFLGIANVPVRVQSIDAVAPIEISIANRDGEVRTTEQRIELPLLGSWFGDLRSLFTDLDGFLQRPGDRRGLGTLNVRARGGAVTGLASMLKTVDEVSGALMVDHLNDRNFARPAMKEQQGG